jgi:hypothetical protein
MGRGRGEEGRRVEEGEEKGLVPLGRLLSPEGKFFWIPILFRESKLQSFT